MLKIMSISLVEMVEQRRAAVEMSCAEWLIQSDLRMPSNVSN